MTKQPVDDTEKRQLKINSRIIQDNLFLTRLMRLKCVLNTPKTKMQRHRIG